MRFFYFIFYVFFVMVLLCVCGFIFVCFDLMRKVIFFVDDVFLVG